jgi:hypothetical protein
MSLFPTDPDVFDGIGARGSAIFVLFTNLPISGTGGFDMGTLLTG